MDTEFNTPWRKTASAIYSRPTDGKIWGCYDIDITSALALIEEKKSNGIPLTLTQLVASAIGRAYWYDVPELNCYTRRGNIYHRDDVGVFISVELPDSKEMTGFVLKNPHMKTLDQVASEVTSRVEHHRAKIELGAVKHKYMLAELPWFLRVPAFRLIRWLTVDCGISLKYMKVDAHSFGSVILSNIGSHDLKYGGASILPVSTIPVVVIMGKIEKRPVVVDDTVVIRDILPMSSTLDHRVCDGAMGGRLAKALNYYLTNPGVLDLVEEKNTVEEQVIR